MLSGFFTALFGLGYFWDIHVLWYFIVVQVCCAGACPAFITVASPQFSSGFQGIGVAQFSEQGSPEQFHSPQNLAVRGVGVETAGRARLQALLWQHQPLPV